MQVMNGPKIFSLIGLLALSGCSQILKSNPCDEAIKNNQLQETFIRNISAFNFKKPLIHHICITRNGISKFCEINTQVSDAKKLSETDFSSSCNANIKFSVKIIDIQGYKNERNKKIAEVRDSAKSKRQELNISDEDIAKLKEELAAEWRQSSEIMAKRETLGAVQYIATKESQEIFTINFNYPENIQPDSYFVVSSVDFTITPNNGEISLSIDQANVITSDQ